MFAAGPILSSASPVINSIVSGGDLGGVLPEKVVGAAKNFLNEAGSGQLAGKITERVEGILSTLRGGPVSMRIPEMPRGVGELGADLFPNGLRLPGLGELEQGVQRIKDGAFAFR